VCVCVCVCVTSRLKKGLDAVTGEEVSDGSEADESTTTTSGSYRSSSFDVAPPGYVAPPVVGPGWLAGLLSSSSADADAAATATVDMATPACVVAGAAASGRLYYPNCCKS